MTKTGIFLITMMITAILTAIYIKIVYFNPEKILAEINQSMQAYDPRNGFSVQDDQKDDCIEWAYGKDWEKMKWNYRADRFRELHPELDPNDFSDATPILLYNKRVSDAYLNQNIIKKAK